MDITDKKLLAIQPDGFSRYYVLSAILKKRFGKRKISILEVGGKETLLPDFFESLDLPYDLTVADVLPNDEKNQRFKYIQQDFLKNNFQDKSFSAVVTTDVLEYISDRDKELFISELTRISKQFVIIAAPMHSVEIEKAERRVNDIFLSITGKDHPWLKEHFELIKPDIRKIEKVLKKNKFQHSCIESNNLNNWILSIISNLLPARFSIDEKYLKEINIFYNKHLLEIGDLEEPGYRTFVVADRNEKFNCDFLIENVNIRRELLIEWKVRILELITKELLSREQKLGLLSEQNKKLSDLLTEKNSNKEVNEELIRKNEKLQSHARNLEVLLNQIKSSKTFKLWQLFNKLKRVAVYTITHPSNVITVIQVALSDDGRARIISKLKKIGGEGQDYSNSINDQYQEWIRNNYPTENEIKEQRMMQSKFDYRPKISIIVPTYKTNITYLKEMIDSVKEQSYDNWELCIADDASNDAQLTELLNKYSKLDNRIKFKIRKNNGHICKASNTALTLASGEYIALLDHDDILWPNALFENVKLLNADKSADLIYSDEDKLEEDGVTHVDPFFKPDWSPSYLRSINYITHFAVIRRSIVEKVGGFRPGLEGTQDWDLFLRISNITDKIFHVPTVLYSWRKSETSTASEIYAEKAKSYAYVNQKRALKDDLSNRNLKGKVKQTKYLGLWRVKYDLVEKPLVSIIIPTKDKYEFISKLLKSIDKKTTYKNYELLIVDTGSEDEKVFSLYNKYKDKLNIRVLKWDKKFNFAAVSNYGAKNSRGKYLLFLNNDTEIISPDWIESMLEHAQHADIGAVGAKLLYPDKTIQHAGVVLGIGGVANHAYQHVSDLGPATFPMMYAKDAVREVSAVTGACLLCKKKVFNEVGGFDEKYRIAYNDVDFCLKLLDKGYRNIYTPFARLYHHENVSVGNPFKGTRDNDEFWHENEIMYEHWTDIISQDQYYNCNLSRNSTNFSLKI